MGWKNLPCVVCKKKIHIFLCRPAKILKGPATSGPPFSYSYQLENDFFFFLPVSSPPFYHPRLNSTSVRKGTFFLAIRYPTPVSNRPYCCTLFLKKTGSPLPHLLNYVTIKAMTRSIIQRINQSPTLTGKLRYTKFSCLNNK